MTDRNDTCTQLTARVIALLEQGTVPWRQPWTAGGSQPTNAVTGAAYRGSNLFTLITARCFGGYEDGRWLTYKQALSLGGHVRKGERGTTLVLWKRVAQSEESDEKPRGGRSVMRYFTVFNVEQCDGLELPTREPSSVTPSAAAENLVAAYLAGGPALRHGGGEAYYEPRADRVTLPEMSAFDDVGEYYSTLFHELGHSTGHASRLARDLSGLRGGHEYSREELVAEFTAAFMCGLAGVDNDATLANSAAYLRGWASKLRDEPEILQWAASRAQQAVDFIVGAEVAAVAA